MEHLLTIKNFISEAPELAVHMEFGFTRQLEAKEVNARCGLLVGAMRSWIKKWIRVLEVGEGGKIHGHYVARLHRYAIEWGIDCSREIISRHRDSLELERCCAEWVRDAEDAGKYFSKTWRTVNLD